MTRAYLRAERTGIGRALPGVVLVAALLILGILALVNPMLVLALPVVVGFLICALRPRIGLYALIGMLFFVPVTINAGWPGQTTTYVFFAAAALVICGRLVRTFKGQQKPFESTGILLLLAPLALSGLVHGTSMNQWLTQTRPLMVLVLVIWHVRAESRFDPDLIRRIAIMIAWAAPALLLLAAYQRVTGSWPVLDELAIAKSYTSRGDPSRTAAIMGHPILYGAYCMVVVIITAALKPKHWKILFAAAAIGMVLSGSRSSWVGASIAILIILITTRPKITGKGVFWGFYSSLLTAGAVVLAMIVLPQALDAVWSTLVGRLDNVTESESAFARNLRVSLAWQQISRTDETWWWGLGPGSLVIYFTVAKLKDNLAATFDNSYLTLWYEYGIIPVVVFASAAVLIVLRKGAAVGRLLMLAVLAMVVFFDLYQWPLMFGAAALAVGLCSAGSPGDTAIPSPAESDAGKLPRWASSPAAQQLIHKRQ